MSKKIDATLQHSTRGGARPGAGRKTIDGATGVVAMNISLTPEERDKLKALGGSAWVREQLRKH